MPPFRCCRVHPCGGTPTSGRPGPWVLRTQCACLWHSARVCPAGQLCVPAQRVCPAGQLCVPVQSLLCATWCLLSKKRESRSRAVCFFERRKPLLLRSLRRRFAHTSPTLHPHFAHTLSTLCPHFVRTLSALFPRFACALPPLRPRFGLRVSRALAHAFAFELDETARRSGPAQH